MIKKGEIQDILDGYEIPRIGVLGSHSALEIMDGAKDEGFRTTVFVQKGRDAPYRRFGRIADEIIELDEFDKMADNERQEAMRESSTIIVPHRSFVVYLGYERIENEFRVPVFGNRALFRAEERALPRNQYHLLQEAGIRYPKLVKASEIDAPCIVKVQEKERPLERAFFTVSSSEEYAAKSEEKLSRGIISREALDEAAIEELAIGTYLNFNYFYSPISDRVDFLGAERRLQTNIHDYNALPARQQMEMDIELQNIEVGHTPASIRESLLGPVIKMGERFVAATKREYSPGIIGPFSLQSVITKDLEFIVYDVSLRVPGNPIVATTSPYTKYQFGETFGIGRRIAMEIRLALKQERLGEVLT